MINLGCQSNNIMKSTDCQIFCIKEDNVIIYQQQKYMIRYNFKKEKIIKKIEWVIQKGRRIFDMAHSDKYYFVLCEDWKLHVLNQELIIVHTHQFETKQFIYMQYINQFDYIILIQTHSLSCFRFVQKEKYFTIEFMNLLSGSLEWNKSVKRIGDYLILFNSHELSIFDIPTISHITKLKFQMIIHEAHFAKNQIIIGDNVGQIMIFSIDGGLQHYLERAHEATIISITSDEEYLYTVGNDIQIRIWNFQNIVQMYQQYPLNLMKIIKFTFVTPFIYFIHSSHYLYLTTLNHQLDTFHAHNSSVTAYSNQCISFRNHIYYSLTQKRNLFIPSHTTSVEQIVDSPYEANTYYMHLTNGFLSKWQNDSPTLCYNYKDIRTINGDALSQDINFITFLDISPPLYDAEATFDQKDRNKVQKYFQNKQMEFITLGTNRGALVIVSLNYFQLIYFRVTYNKESIIYIGQLDINCLVVVSQDYTINIINLKPELLKSMKFEFGPLLCIQNKFIMAMKCRFYIFNQELEAYNTQIENETEILGLSANKKHIISFSISQVKIWDILTSNNIFTINFHSYLDHIQINEQSNLYVSVDGFLCEMIVDYKSKQQIYQSYPIITLDQLLIQQYQTPKLMTPLSPQRPTEGGNKMLKIQRGVVINDSSNKKNKSQQKQKSHLKQSPSPKHESFHQAYEGSKSFILPAIPQVETSDKKLINLFVKSRMNRGAPRNRRDHTMDKIILTNLLQLD